MSQSLSVIGLLCEAFPEFKLFWETHFEIIPFGELVPTFDERGNPTFPKRMNILRKVLTPEEKLAFYEKDIELWKEIVEIEQELQGDTDE